MKEVRQLLPYLDLLALSAYPYGPHARRHPRVPEAYFDPARAFGKPIAIAETGLPSQGFKAFGVAYAFTEQDQARYIRLLLKKAMAYHFVFVVNWAPIDFDRMQRRFPDRVLQDTAAFWAYTGLQRSNGEPKVALQLWDGALHLPRR